MKFPTIVAGTFALLLVGVSTVAAQSAPAPQAVTIDNFSFAPAEITVAPGTTLTWTNQQNARHTTTADNGEWDSGILATNQTFSLTMDRVGDFAYHCDIHPEMVGIVHVTAATPAVAEAPVVEATPPSAVVEDQAAQSQAAPVVTAPQPTRVAPAPTPQSSSYGY
jgi:plastocyanin